MQFAAISTALALGLVLAGPSAAQTFQGTAKLATPVSAPTSAIVEGVEWRCEGDTCRGSGERRAKLDSFMKECRKVAAAVGPLTAYTSRGHSLTDRNVATCNRLAAANRPDSQLAAK